MQIDNKLEIVNDAKPHTIKKFQLIEEYVKAWAQKLLNYSECKGIVFIDCMCNSGIYKDDDGNEVFGTPIRVANYISGIMKNYPDKKALIYFSDLGADKIDTLKKHLPGNTNNCTIITKCMDGNELLKEISLEFCRYQRMNYLLVYDPYKATIDWKALMPFLKNWGELILNHMISDTKRGIPCAKRPKVVEEYKNTYGIEDVDKLKFLAKDRDALEKIVTNIIEKSRGIPDKKYYIASFPFFNRKNTIVYNLIHCSSNIKGFRLFKKTAWKTFGGKSSTKNTHGVEQQLMFDIVNMGELTTPTDEYCYYVKDIAKYLYETFKGMENVPVKEVWAKLDEHPVFPSEGYANKIKEILREEYNCKTEQNSITFTERW